MSCLLSHLSDELRNDSHISVCREADGDMTVDLYRYRIASYSRKKTGLIEDHFLKRNFFVT